MKQSKFQFNLVSCFFAIVFVIGAFHSGIVFAETKSVAGRSVTIKSSVKERAPKFIYILSSANLRSGIMSVQLEIRDDLSEVKEVHAVLKANGYDDVIVTLKNNVGHVFEGQNPLPRFVARGSKWNVAFVHTFDKDKNVTIYANGKDYTSADFEVQGPEDSNPPILQKVAILPNYLKVGKGLVLKTIKFTVEATDDVSGINYINVHLWPVGRENTKTVFSITKSTSGNTYVETYNAENLNIPGKWIVGSITLYDKAGRSREYTYGTDYTADFVVTAPTKFIPPPPMIVKSSLVSTTAIHSCEELQNMNKDLDGHYVLANDIDCSQTKSWNQGQGFLPVGAYYDVNLNTTFNGTFDGQGHTIRGLYINRSKSINEASYSAGLFGLIYKNAAISNVKLEDILYKGGGIIGGLVGVVGAYEKSEYVQTIDNVSVQGIIIANKALHVDSVVGGVVGSVAHNKFKINKIVSNVEIIGLNKDGFIGGIAGNNSGSIAESYAQGSIEGVFMGAGGIVANNLGALSNVYSNVEIDYIGNENIGLAGGVVADLKYGGKVNSAYATGSITGLKNKGGVVGLSNGMVFQTLYWAKDTTQTSISAGSLDVNGLSTADMKKKSSFVGWDESIWTFKDNDYPHLKWEQAV